ncbi:MAG: polymerase, sigma-24 subunit, subfamily [Acidobacteriales bacterium]|nr:polymerase, sigma-24 subunit, subfamily [Terriglobales bacterium]
MAMLICLEVVIEVAVWCEELSPLLRLYVERFNRRDWDGLRDLISADARLRVADRFAGRLDESPYFERYQSANTSEASRQGCFWRRKQPG